MRSSQTMPVDLVQPAHPVNRATPVEPVRSRGRASLYSWTGLVSGGLLIASGLLPWVRRGPGWTLNGIEIAAALRGDLDFGTSASRAATGMLAIMVVGLLHIASAAASNRVVAVVRGASGATIGVTLIVMRSRMGGDVWASGEYVCALGAVVATVAAIAGIVHSIVVRRGQSASEPRTAATSNLRAAGIAVCVVSTIVAAGVVGYTYRFGDGRPGASTPLAAVDKFFGAVNDNDALVLATSVVPSEAESAGAFVASLAKTLGIDDIGTWDASDSSFEIAVDVTNTTELARTGDTADVEVDGSLSLSGLQLPSPLDGIFGDTIELDLDRLGPTDDETGATGLVLKVVQQHGRWYVSPNALAEGLREYVLSIPGRVVESATDSIKEAIKDVLDKLPWFDLTADDSGRIDEDAADAELQRPELTPARSLSTRFNARQLSSS